MRTPWQIGFKPTLTGSLQNQDKRGTPEYETVANAYKQMRQQPVDRSFTSAFQQGLDAPLENMATTARMLGAEGTADTLSGLTTAPENYESAANRFINPQQGDFTVGGFAPGYLPRAAVEQAGQLAGSLATRAGGATLGSAFGPKGTVVGALAGPALFEFVQQLGPIAAERARNNGTSRTRMGRLVRSSGRSRRIRRVERHWCPRRRRRVHA